MKPESLLFSLNGSTVPSATCLHKALTEVLPANRLAKRLPSALRVCIPRLHCKCASELRGACAGHGSDEVTKRHYIAESAMDSAVLRVSEALAGDLDV